MSRVCLALPQARNQAADRQLDTSPDPGLDLQTGLQLLQVQIRACVRLFLPRTRAKRYTDCRFTGIQFSRTFMASVPAEL